MNPVPAEVAKSTRNVAGHKVVLWKNMKSLLDRLIYQLDTLIPFIGISYRDVFDLIQKEKNIWFHDDQEKLPKTYETYRKQINHSAFILGYSYFEAFLNDLAKEIFLSRPSMLASNKTIKFEDVTNSSSYPVFLAIVTSSSGVN